MIGYIFLVYGADIPIGYLTKVRMVCVSCELIVVARKDTLPTNVLKCNSEAANASKQINKSKVIHLPPCLVRREQ